MSERPNRFATWGLRSTDYGSYVGLLGSDSIHVVLNNKSVAVLSRKDARLLAKRINQCLDETRKP